MTDSPQGADVGASCSFCGRARSEVERLIAGRQVFICGACVSLCADIIRDLEASSAPGPRDEPSLAQICRRLSESVVGNREAQRALVVAVASFDRWVARRTTQAPFEVPPKPNILLVGPTGTGKSLTVQTLAAILGRAFAVQQASLSWRTDYYLRSSFVDELFASTDRDIQKAQRAIVVVDNVDQLAAHPVEDAFRRETVALLTHTVESANWSWTDTKAGSERGAAPLVDTEPMLFIGTGTFDAPAGGEQGANTEGVGVVSHEELAGRGYSRELLARFPVIISLAALSASDYRELLLDAPHQYLRQISDRFALDDVKVEFLPEAVDTIAAAAVDKQQGVRGLASILDTVATRIGVEVRRPPGRKSVSVDGALRLQERTESGLS